MLIETLRGGSERDKKIETMMGILSTAGYESWEIDTRERDLKAYKPDFRFVRCTYPHLPQNTLFVHTSRRQSLLDSPPETH